MKKLIFVAAICHFSSGCFGECADVAYDPEIHWIANDVFYWNIKIMESNPNSYCADAFEKVNKYSTHEYTIDTRTGEASVRAQDMETLIVPQRPSNFYDLYSSNIRASSCYQCELSIEVADSPKNASLIVNDDLPDDGSLKPFVFYFRDADVTITAHHFGYGKIDRLN